VPAFIKILIPNPRHRHKIYKFIVDFAIRPRVKSLGVPIIAISGSSGKSAVTKLLNQIYLKAGYRVGMCCTTSVMRNGKILTKGDKSGPSGLWRLAVRRGLDLIVAETSRGGIIRHGLGFHECMVGLITNIYEEHIGQDGINSKEEMADVKSQVVEHTRADGTVILNADDALVSGMALKTKADITWFTLKDDPPFDKMTNCFFVNKGSIYRRINGVIRQVIPVKDIAITFGGILQHQTANVLAALAVIESLKTKFSVLPETLHTVLADFGKDPNDHAGKFSILRFKDEIIMLCHCKIDQAYKLNLPLIQKAAQDGGFDNRVGIISYVDGRLDTYYQKISKAAAQTCDGFFIHPPDRCHFRYRSKEELTALLSSSIPPDKIVSTGNETLSTIFHKSRTRFKGKILYIIFHAHLLGPGFGIESLYNDSTPLQWPLQESV